MCLRAASCVTAYIVFHGLRSHARVRHYVFGGVLVPAGDPRWGRFMDKILHVMGTPEELSDLLGKTLRGSWDLENDCRMGSVTRFAASRDPRAVGACTR